MAAVVSRDKRGLASSLATKGLVPLVLMLILWGLVSLGRSHAADDTIVIKICIHRVVERGSVPEEC
jgi:hypothetical protein